MENLPKNWVEIELGDILRVKNGFAFKSKEYCDEGIPLIRMSDIIDNKITTSKAARVKPQKQFERYVIDKGDILIGMSGSIGKYGIFDLDETVYLNQRVGNLKLLSPEKINKKLIYYLVGFIQQKVVDSSYGGAVPNISSKQIEKTKFNLPPLKEQQRIVAKLDSLFGHLDSLKQRLEHIPTLLKQFRQSVLTQAVTGKLTEEWREGKELNFSINDVKSKVERFDFERKVELPETWKLIKAESITSKITDGEHQTPKRIESGRMLLSAKNVRNGFMDYDNHDFISEEDFVKCLKRCKAEKNDVLIVSVGATIGRTAIVREDKEFALVRSVGLLKPNEFISGNYLMYSLQCEILQDVIAKVSQGSAQSCLYINKIKGLPIPLPSIEEQTEIVRRVEALFVKADSIEAAYNKLKQQIDNLPQAILAKAFKGELVEQLPTDGDAKALLKEIAALRASLEKEKKSKKKQIQ